MSMTFRSFQFYFIIICIHWGELLQSNLGTDSTIEFPPDENWFCVASWKRNGSVWTTLSCRSLKKCIFIWLAMPRRTSHQPNWNKYSKNQCKQVKHYFLQHLTIHCRLQAISLGEILKLILSMIYSWRHRLGSANQRTWFQHHEEISPRQIWFEPVKVHFQWNNRSND